MPFQCGFAVTFHLGQQLKGLPKPLAFLIRHSARTCTTHAQLSAALSSSICSSLAFTPSPPPP